VKTGKTKDGNPQVNFHFDLEQNGKRYHIYVLELWTNYQFSFMVTHDGGWVNFNWDGEKWIHEMKDHELAKRVIDILVMGYDSKIVVSGG